MIPWNWRVDSGQHNDKIVLNAAHRAAAIVAASSRDSIHKKRINLQMTDDKARRRTKCSKLPHAKKKRTDNDRHLAPRKELYKIHIENPEASVEVTMSVQ